MPLPHQPPALTRSLTKLLLITITRNEEGSNVFDALTMWLFGVPAFPFGMMMLLLIALGIVWLIGKFRSDG